MINGERKDNHKPNPTKSDFGGFKSQLKIEPYMLKIPMSNIKSNWIIWDFRRRMDPRAPEVAQRPNPVHESATKALDLQRG